MKKILLGIMKIKIGDKFGKWTVIGDTDSRKVLCTCSCGRRIAVNRGNLLGGRSSGCRWCASSGKPSVQDHRLYSTWKSMKTRCYNPNCWCYHRYGGRGIKVCDKWKDSFMSFVEDMYPTYEEGLTLDRIDNDGDYEASNCRWSTRREQSSNTDSNVEIEYRGTKYTEAELSRKFGIKRTTVQMRRRLGWSPEEVVNGKPGIRRDGIYYRGVHYKTIKELAESIGINPLTMAYRIRSGWTIEEAVNTPIKK